MALEVDLPGTDLGEVPQASFQCSSFPQPVGIVVSNVRARRSDGAAGLPIRFARSSEYCDGADVLPFQRPPTPELNPTLTLTWSVGGARLLVAAAGLG